MALVPSSNNIIIVNFRFRSPHRRPSVRPSFRHFLPFFLLPRLPCPNPTGQNNKPKVANNPGSCEEWYLGDERDGVRHGHGAAFFTSGDVYLGQVLNQRLAVNTAVFLRQ